MLEGFKLYATIALALLFVFKSLSSRRKKSLPPGPSGYPLIGNAFDIPKGYSALGWAKFRDSYGEF